MASVLRGRGAAGNRVPSGPPLRAPDDPQHAAREQKPAAEEGQHPSAAGTGGRASGSARPPPARAVLVRTGCQSRSTAGQLVLRVLGLLQLLGAPRGAAGRPRRGQDQPGQRLRWHPGAGPAGAARRWVLRGGQGLSAAASPPAGPGGGSGVCSGATCTSCLDEVVSNVERSMLGRGDRRWVSAAPTELSRCLAEAAYERTLLVDGEETTLLVLDTWEPERRVRGAVSPGWVLQEPQLPSGLGVLRDDESRGQTSGLGQPLRRSLLAMLEAERCVSSASLMGLPQQGPVSAGAALHGRSRVGVPHPMWVSLAQGTKGLQNRAWCEPVAWERV